MHAMVCTRPDIAHSDTVLQGYVDVDMASDKDSRRSTIGYVFNVGATTVSWISKVRKVVAL